MDELYLLGDNTSITNQEVHERHLQTASMNNTNGEDQG